MCARISTASNVAFPWLGAVTVLTDRGDPSIIAQVIFRRDVWSQNTNLPADVTADPYTFGGSACSDERHAASTASLVHSLVCLRCGFVSL